MSELSSPRRSRRPLFFGGVIGAALATGAVLIVATGGGETADVPAYQQPQTVQQLHLMAAPEVLTKASKVAAGQPELNPRPDQFLYFESKSKQDTWQWGVVNGLNGKPVPPDHYTEEIHRKTWFSVNGKQASLLRTRSSGSVRKPVEGQQVEGRPGWTQEWLCSGQPQKVDLNNPPTGKGCETELKFRKDLPTDTDAMVKWLYKHSKGGNPPDVQAFITVGDTIREAYLSRSLATLFAAAAKIPGTKVTQDVTDLAGRKGIAVGQTWHGTRHDLIFDAKTFEYLGEREVADYDTSFRPQGGSTPEPNGWKPDEMQLKFYKPGHVLYESVVLRTAVTDRPGQEP